MKELTYNLIASNEDTNEVTYLVTYKKGFGKAKVRDYVDIIKHSFNNPRNFPEKEIQIGRYNGCRFGKYVFAQDVMVESKINPLEDFLDMEVDMCEMVTKVNLEEGRRFIYTLYLKYDDVLKRTPRFWQKWFGKERTNRRK